MVLRCSRLQRAPGSGLQDRYTYTDMHMVRPTDTLTDAWRVFKFGGSSVADAACMRARGRHHRRGAGGPTGGRAVGQPGVTDGLLALVAAAERQEDDEEPLAALRHAARRDGEGALSRRPRPGPTRGSSTPIAATSARCCRPCGWPGRRPRRRAISSSGSASCGPRGSSPGCSRPARRRPGVRWVDARDIVEVEWGHLGPAVRWESSRAKAAAAVRRRPGVDADRARVHRAGSAGDPDHARPQRQRFLGLDPRRPLERLRDPHLDRRGRRAERRPAPRARRAR